MALVLSGSLVLVTRFGIEAQISAVIIMRVASIANWHVAVFYEVSNQEKVTKSLCDLHAVLEVGMFCRLLKAKVV